MSQPNTNSVRLELRVTPKIKEELLEITEVVSKESGNHYSMTTIVAQLIHMCWKKYNIGGESKK